EAFRIVSEPCRARFVVHALVVRLKAGDARGFGVELVDRQIDASVISRGVATLEDESTARLGADPCGVGLGHRCLSSPGSRRSSSRARLAGGSGPRGSG